MYAESEYLRFSYADIGEKAFGKLGRAVTTVTQYATLCGITIIYLILLGRTFESVNLTV